MKWLKHFLITALLIIPLTVAAHGGTHEAVANFVSRIEIDKNNVATITEDITYDFGSLEQHGILRYVPLKTDAGGSKYYFYNFEFMTALMDGQPVKASIEKDGNWQVVRLGEADTTITGAHLYSITYKMWPVMEKDVNGDWLNWNLTGNYWEVPIEAASAQVTFPAGIEIKNVRCYSGPVGSTAENCRLATENNKVLATSLQSLAPGEGLTLNALVDSGGVNNYQLARKPPLSHSFPLGGIILGILSALAGLVARFIGWLQHRRQLADQTIVPQYESPNKLTPGEIGLLSDNRATMAEITATLIDLAVRGYIKIEQTSPKGIFKKPKYAFTKLRDFGQGLESYEHDLLTMLFTNSTDGKSVSLDEVTTSQAATTITKIKSTLKASLEAKGYYAKPETGKRKLPLGKLILVGIALVIGLNIYAIKTGASSALVWPSIISMVVGPILGWTFSRRTQLSAAGYKEWAEIEGFKLFMSVTEKERLAFHDAPLKNPKLFSTLLPFAVALGVERLWANQFKDMDVAAATGWYGGPGHFNSAALAGSLSSDFSSAVSSNFTPAQSSGGSSGGGSSGGGGGGGGGGSW